MSKLVFQHDSGCRYARESDGGHSDASKRVSDEHNLHLIGSGNRQAAGRWIACRLSDGSSDHVLYDTKPDAAAHQHHNERRMLFVRVALTSMSVCEAATLLRSARMLYDLGNDQSGDRVVIPRLTNEHQARQLARLQQSIHGR